MNEDIQKFIADCLRMVSDNFTNSDLEQEHMNLTTQKYIADQLSKALSNLEGKGNRLIEKNQSQSEAIALGVQIGLELAAQLQTPNSARPQPVEQTSNNGTPTTPPTQISSAADRRITALKLRGYQAAARNNQLTALQRSQIESGLNEARAIAIQANCNPLIRVGERLSFPEQLIEAEAELSVLQKFDVGGLRVMELLDGIKALRGWINEGRRAV